MPTPIYRLVEEAYLAVFGFKDSNLRRPCLNEITLHECDSSWNVNVEQMQFSVLCHDISLPVETETCVEYLFLPDNLLWEAATNDVFVE